MANVDVCKCVKDIGFLLDKDQSDDTHFVIITLPLQDCLACRLDTALLQQVTRLVSCTVPLSQCIFFTTQQIFSALTNVQYLAIHQYCWFAGHHLHCKKVILKRKVRRCPPLPPQDLRLFESMVHLAPAQLSIASILQMMERWMRAWVVDNKQLCFSCHHAGFKLMTKALSHQIF